MPTVENFLNKIEKGEEHLELNVRIHGKLYLVKNMYSAYFDGKFIMEISF
jgi:hypothetical protein